MHNQRAFEITGFAAEEIKKGMNVLSFVVSEEQEKTKENISKSMRGEDIGTNEYVLLRKKRVHFPCAC